MNAPFKQISIAGTNLSSFSLVLPENPTLTEQTAAKELTEHFAQAADISLSAAHLPEKPAHGIYVGRACDHDRSGIEHDGYIIATDENNLYLYGAIDRGTLYACYRFLEKYIGFRKYEPSVGRLLPGDVNVQANLLDSSNPAFSERSTSWAAYTQDAAHAAWNGINQGRKDMEAYGGHLKVAAGSCHTFGALVEPELYFDEHPEYYSLWGGKRIPAGNTYEIVGQLCLTNLEVLEIAKATVRRWLAATPDAEIVEVSHSDNQRYCRCEHCAAVDAEEGAPSGLLLRFVNAIAEDIEKDYPNVLVRTFAYQYTRKAPKITKARKNVLIRYCTIEACQNHSLDDPNCAVNVAFAPEIAEWKEICNQLSVWDYTCNFSCYFAPTVNLHVLADNARFFAENKALHVFEEDIGTGTYTGDIGGLKAYLLARLLWNPYMSKEELAALTDDFLEGYYGPGWRNVREYVRLLKEDTEGMHLSCWEEMDIAEENCSIKQIRVHYQPRQYQNVWETSYLNRFIETHLEEAKRLWDDMLKQTDDEAQRERIRRSRMTLTYLDLFCKKYVKEEMTLDERRVYERAVSDFLHEKIRMNLRWNIWTSHLGR